MPNESISCQKRIKINESDIIVKFLERINFIGEKVN